MYNSWDKLPSFAIWLEAGFSFILSFLVSLFCWHFWSFADLQQVIEVIKFHIWFLFDNWCFTTLPWIMMILIKQFQGIITVNEWEKHIYCNINNSLIDTLASSFTRCCYEIAFFFKYLLCLFCINLNGFCFPLTLHASVYICAHIELFKPEQRTEIVQRTSSNGVSWKKIIVFGLKYCWSVFPVDKHQHWLR